jgi:hypothetical protein
MLNIFLSRILYYYLKHLRKNENINLNSYIIDDISLWLVMGISME